MLAAAPPARMIPWMRTSDRTCWRSMLTALYIATTASRALMPSSGGASGVGGLAVEEELEAPRGQRALVGHGGLGGRVEHDRGVDVVEDAGLNHVDLAAGVRGGALLGRRPSTQTEPARSPSTSVSASPAPSADVAIRLWPQPWPSFGSASYSARTAIGRPGRAARKHGPERRLHAGRAHLNLGAGRR